MVIQQNLTTNRRIGGLRPSAIVIHWWDDPKKNPTLDGVVSWFKNPASQVSAHYVVSDEVVVQMVRETDQAWHAVSANAYALGVEINPNFPGKTYETVGALVRDIRSRHGNIPLIRHSDVPGTFTACPGATDLDLIERYARGEDVKAIETIVDKDMAIKMLALWGRRGGSELAEDAIGSIVGKQFWDAADSLMRGQEDAERQSRIKGNAATDPIDRQKREEVVAKAEAFVKDLKESLI